MESNAPFPAAPRGKGMLAAIITGVWLLASSLICGLFFVMEVTATGKLQQALEQSRGQGASSAGEFATALHAAQVLTTYFAIVALVAFVCGVGLEVLGIAVWVSRRSRIAAGESPSALLRLGIPAMAAVVVLALVIVGLSWRAAAGSGTRQWITERQMRDSQELEQKQQQELADRERNRREKIYDALKTLAGDADDVQRKAAYRYLTMEDRFGLPSLPRTEELRNSVASALLHSRDLIASDERMRREFDQFDSFLDAKSRQEYQEYFGVHRYDYLDPKSDTAASAAFELLKGGQNARGAFEQMLAHGVSPDRVHPTNGETLLTAAIQVNRPEYPPIVLGHGADPNLPDGRGDFGLYLAAEKEDASLVKLLLERKANVNQRIERAAGIKPIFVGRAQGRTALSIAVERSPYKPEVVQMLLDAGADPNIPDETERTPLDYFRMMAANWRGPANASDIEKALLAKGAGTFADLPPDRKALASPKSAPGRGGAP